MKTKKKVAVAKKKVTKKTTKKPVKKTSKKTISKSVSVKKPTKKIKVGEAELVMFDSEINQGNALFVSNPEPDQQTPEAVLPSTDPEIEKALEEFDGLPQTPEAVETPEVQEPEVQDNNIEPAFAEASAFTARQDGEAKKKSFWKKIFPFFK